jgi:hypothetical protein
VTTIQDEYEIPDDDDDFDVPFDLTLARRKRRSFAPLYALLGAVAVGAVIVVGHNEATTRQNNDQFCVACHNDQHTLYSERALNASNGALAVDLSSYHYQQIRGNGGDIRCIDCHRGADSDNARIETNVLSARISLAWLLLGEQTGAQASAGVITASNGVTTFVGSSALSAPHLSNDGCITCHADILLTAGIDNHMHNTLPAAYALWKNGAQLIAPNGAADAQAIVARGLQRYETAVRCSDCHLTHRETDAENYQHEPTTQRQCVQCHTDAGVTINRR